jgi:hypothetical protein
MFDDRRPQLAYSPFAREVVFTARRPSRRAPSATIIFSRLGNTFEAEKRQASDEDAPQPLAAGRATVT